MFKHGMTGKTYYSVREKLRYYRGIVAGKITDVPAATKRKARLTYSRLAERYFVVRSSSVDDR